MTRGIDVSDLIFQATADRTYVDLAKTMRMPEGTIRKLADAEYTPGARILRQFIHGFARVDRRGLIQKLNSHLFDGTGMKLVEAADRPRPGHLRA